MHALIIGGTSGLGLELAKQFKGRGWDVTVTGRNLKSDDWHYYLDIETCDKQLSGDIGILIKHSPTIDCLIYAAGFFQEGHISDLSDREIIKMGHVGLIAPAFLLQRILKKQDRLEGFIAITSTSQMIPRELEPMYTAVKAGMGMLAHSVSLDKRVGKVLVAAPAGMQTNFWKGEDRGDNLLDPAWAAKEILKLYEKDFRYYNALVLRDPPRTEVIRIEK